MYCNAVFDQNRRIRGQSKFSQTRFNTRDIGVADVNLALMSQMIQETTGRSIRCVHRAQEPPAFRKQLSHCCGFKLGEKAATMNHSEMTDKSVEIDLLSHNSKAGGLLKIEP